MTKAYKLEWPKARICTWNHLSQRQWCTWFYLGCSWQKPPWNPVPRQTRSPGASDTGGWTYLNKRVCLGPAEGGAREARCFQFAHLSGGVDRCYTRAPSHGHSGSSTASRWPPCRSWAGCRSNPHQHGGNTHPCELRCDLEEQRWG